MSQRPDLSYFAASIPAWMISTKLAPSGAMNRCIFDLRMMDLRWALKNRFRVRRTRVVRPTILIALASFSFLFIDVAQSSGAAHSQHFTLEEVSGVKYARMSCTHTGCGGFAQNRFVFFKAGQWINGPLIPKGFRPAMISCTSVQWCMSIGNHGGPTTSNNNEVLIIRNTKSTSLSKISDPLEANLLGVSCVSPQFCMAVGFDLNSNDGLVELWDGTAWSHTSTDLAAQGVSCASQDFCMLAEVNQAQAYVNGSWSSPQLVDMNSLDSISVSCPTASIGWCGAVGSSGFVYLYDNGEWAPNSDVGFLTFHSNFGGSSIACVSKSSCVIGGGTADSGQTSAFNGVTWSPGVEGAVGAHRFFSDVSCESASACFLSELTGRVWRFR